MSGGIITTCKGCPIEVICQRRYNPPQVCINNRHSSRPNGYAVLGAQEQQLRMDAIENRGDFG